MRRTLALAVVLLLAAAACSTGGSNLSQGGQGQAGQGGATATTKAKRSTKRSSDPDTVVNNSIDDIEAYWADAMRDAYGIDYTTLRGGRHPYDEDTPPKACGPQQATYDELKGNAFYCPQGDFIAYDRGFLVPQLIKRYGPFSVALVLAHEWGHAIQTRGRASQSLDTIVLEQQADCFAGAWAKHQVETTDVKVALEEGDLDKGLGALTVFRDPPGADPTQQGAHGSGFDRVNAFQEGFEQGPKRCAAYAKGDAPKPVEMPFTGSDDARRGGNYPYDAFTRNGKREPGAADLAAADLNDFMATRAAEAGLTFEPVDKIVAYTVGENVPTCDGRTLSDDEATQNIFYCRGDNTIAFDDGFMRQVYEETGDFGVATLLAQQFAVAAQLHSGVNHETRASRTQASCLVGAWAHSVVKRDRSSSQVTLSPGDLDETIQSYLSYADDPADPDHLSVFDKAKALRGGFADGATACQQ